MAATALRTNVMCITAGQNGRLKETHTIFWDSDATVEVNTTLKKIEFMGDTDLTSGGAAATLSLDEAAAIDTDGRITVGTTGAVTVDASATTASNKNLIYFVGY